MILQPDQVDALTEVANLGISSASVQLSELLGAEVMMDIPEVKLIPLRDAPNLFSYKDEKMGIIIQELGGALDGRANLAFLSDESKALVHAFLDTLPPIDDGEVDTGYYVQEALEEIGNIVISSCISEFANQLDSEITLTVPTFIENRFSEIFSYDNKDEMEVMIIMTSLEVAEMNLHGMMIILLTHDSTDRLLKSLAEFIERKMQELQGP